MENKQKNTKQYSRYYLLWQHVFWLWEAQGKRYKRKGWFPTRNSPLKAPDIYMQVDESLLIISSAPSQIKTVRYQKWARKKWADMFCVLWLEQGIFVCNTFKKFVQYKIGFMGFFFLLSSQQNGKTGGVKNVNTGICF